MKIKTNLLFFHRLLDFFICMMIVSSFPSVRVKQLLVEKSRTTRFLAA